MMHLIPYGSSEAYIQEEHAGQRHTITAILPREEVEELYRRLAGWLPIESAPRDRYIMLWCPEDQSRWLAKWQSGEWYGVDAEHGLTRTDGYHDGSGRVTGWRITLWQPLPSPPKEPQP